MKFVLLSKKALIRTIVAIVVIGVIIAIVGFTKTSGVFLGKPLSKSPAINSVDTDQKQIIITIELNSDVDTNKKLFESIEKYDIPFVAFIDGQSVDKNKEWLKEYLGNELISFGINGNVLTDNTELSSKEIAQEIDAGKTILQKAINKNVEYYRAPFGKYNDNLIQEAQKAGLFPLGGDINTLDYANNTSNDLARTLISKVKNGSIININSMDTNVINIIPIGVVGLQSLGYKFGNINDLIIRDNYTITSDGRQIKK